ncbi:MAG: NAD(P)/FAD-dependent oxidoreductase [Candidatus Thermoplasmatota archaeon]
MHKSEQLDVAVAGGGPVGGYIATKTAEKGYNTTIFEKKAKIGRPVGCAGLVSNRTLKFLNLPKEKIIQNKIKGANIHSPSGKTLTIGGDKIHAYVIDRVKFDESIIEKAVENGSELILKHKLINAKKYGKRIEIKTNGNKKYFSKILVGADGPFSKTRSIFNLPEPKEKLKGIGAEIKNVELNPDFVEIFLGDKIAPGFFSWLIPTNGRGTKARMGLCISEEATNTTKHFFSSFFVDKRVKPFLKNVKVEKKIAGTIPLGLIKKSFSDNFLLVGDAAEQIKPTSGGGLFTGLTSAQHSVSVILEALQKNNFSEDFLKKYQKSWKKTIGHEIKIGMAFRKIYKKFSDEQINHYLDKLDKPEIKKVIRDYGDIDFPSKLVKPLFFKAPYFLKFLPGYIKNKFF